MNFDLFEMSAAADVPAEETIAFKSPQSRSQVLYVWGLRDLSWDCRMCELNETFSRFGLLYSIYVPPADELSYAFVKYYSKQAALKALRSTHGKAVIGQTVLKVTPTIMSK